MNLLDTQVFPLIGEEGFTRLVAAFYRQVPSDEILGPMYSRRDIAAAEERHWTALETLYVEGTAKLLARI